MPPLTMLSFNHSRGSVLPPEVIEAARRHWRLFPVQPHGRFAVSTGDIKEATSDLDQIERWAVEQPGLSWALATGESSGVFVLEINTEQGRNGLSTLCGDDWGWCQTLQSKSGDTGYAYFRWPAALTLCNAGGRIAAGLSIRADGDYVILPQSMDSSGQPHVWLNPDDIAAAPQWLLDRAFAPSKTRASAKILPFPDRATQI
jgi:putative DNA primase/helicase